MLANEIQREQLQARLEFMSQDQLSPNFSRNEFRCKGGDDCCGGAAPVDSRLILALQELRELVNAPIRILSGFRCVKYNKGCGGAQQSQHCLGTAADIRVEGVSTERLATIASTVPYFGDGGIGTYDRGWVHVDVRQSRARWHSK